MASGVWLHLSDLFSSILFLLLFLFFLFYCWVLYFSENVHFVTENSTSGTAQVVENFACNAVTASLTVWKLDPPKSARCKFSSSSFQKKTKKQKKKKKKKKNTAAEIATNSMANRAYISHHHDLFPSNVCPRKTSHSHKCYTWSKSVTLVKIFKLPALDFCRLHDQCISISYRLPVRIKRICKQLTVLLVHNPIMFKRMCVC